jgi:hypothetical protein
MAIRFSNPTCAQTNRLPVSGSRLASTTQAMVRATKAAPSYGVYSMVDTTWARWMTATAPRPRMPVARGTASSACRAGREDSMNVDVGMRLLRGRSPPGLRRTREISGLCRRSTARVCKSLWSELVHRSLPAADDEGIEVVQLQNGQLGPSSESGEFEGPPETPTNGITLRRCPVWISAGFQGVVGALVAAPVRIARSDGVR